MNSDEPMACEMCGAKPTPATIDSFGYDIEGVWCCGLDRYLGPASKGGN